jgi:pantothenate kinase
MDGWHYPNTVLDARQTTDERGRPVSLRRRKGSPESYDVPALAAALHALRTAGRPVSLPAYDRRRHDPVPDTLKLEPHTRIVLIEGNYLLSNAPPWDQVSALLDVRLYIESDPAACRERVIARHVRGGLSEAEAVKKYDFNDAPNTRIVQSTAGRADVVIRL